MIFISHTSLIVLSAQDGNLFIMMALRENNPNFTSKRGLERHLSFRATHFKHKTFIIFIYSFTHKILIEHVLGADTARLLGIQE